MPVARCPRCETQVTIDDADVGYDVECPTCRAVFSTNDVLDGPPTVRRPARPQRDDDFDDDERPRPRRRIDPEDLIDDARRAVLLPGIFVAGVSIIGIGLALLELLMFAILGGQQMQQMANVPFLNAGPPPSPEALIGARVLAVVWESVILAGTFCMMRGKALGFARTAMMMRLIPCAGFCCILGLPFGIWALVVLNRPDVQEGFKLAAGGSRSGSWDRG